LYYLGPKLYIFHPPQTMGFVGDFTKLHNSPPELYS
jgi:hypothetical protein